MSIIEALKSSLILFDSTPLKNEKVGRVDNTEIQEAIDSSIQMKMKVNLKVKSRVEEFLLN